MFPWNLFRKIFGSTHSIPEEPPPDSDHTQSQLSKHMGYGKHDISKSRNIEDSIFLHRVILVGDLCNEPLSSTVYEASTCMSWEISSQSYNIIFLKAL